MKLLGNKFVSFFAVIKLGLVLIGLFVLISAELNAAETTHKRKREWRKQTEYSHLTKVLKFEDTKKNVQQPSIMITEWTPGMQVKICETDTIARPSTRNKWQEYKSPESAQSGKEKIKQPEVQKSEDQNLLENGQECDWFEQQASLHDEPWFLETAILSMEKEKEENLRAFFMMDFSRQGRYLYSLGPAEKVEFRKYLFLVCLNPKILNQIMDNQADDALATKIVSDAKYYINAIDYRPMRR